MWEKNLRLKSFKLKGAWNMDVMFLTIIGIGALALFKLWVPIFKKLFST
jgi:hypothetical protein